MHSVRIGMALAAVVSCYAQTPAKEYVYLGGRLLAIESTAPTVPAGTPPQTGTVNFPSSAAVNQAATITATFTAGASSIDQAVIIFNEDVWGWRGCYVGYNPSAGFFLASDEFNPMVPPYAPYWLGPSLPQSNSFCTLNAGSSANPTGPIGPGQSVTVTFNITFKSALAGTSGVFAAVADTAGGSSGFISKGTITATPAGNAAFVSSVTPNSASGSGAAFVLSSTDVDTDRNVAWTLLNIVAPNSTNCALMFISFTKGFYVSNDAYNGWNGIQSQNNSRCTLVVSGTQEESQATLGNALLSVTFNTTFSTGTWSGPRELYGQVQDRGENFRYGFVGTFNIQ
ncbi:MAG: hypothetical protein R2762_24220 [Bryobacteraceae bacterium]